MSSVSCITTNTAIVAHNSRATQAQEKRVAILYFSDGDSVNLFEDNDLLTADKTKCLDTINGDEVNFTELENYIIIFNTLKPKPLGPLLYNKDYLPQLKGINPYSREEITDVFEVKSKGVITVKVQGQDKKDKTEDILGFSLSKRSDSEFQRNHLYGTLEGRDENYSQHYNSLPLRRSGRLTVFNRIVAQRRRFGMRMFTISAPGGMGMS